MKKQAKDLQPGDVVKTELWSQRIKETLKRSWSIVVFFDNGMYWSLPLTELVEVEV